MAVPDVSLEALRALAASSEDEDPFDEADPFDDADVEGFIRVAEAAARRSLGSDRAPPRTSEKIEGQYGVVAADDAGSCIVPLGMSWSAMNDSTAAWLHLIEPVRAYYGDAVESRVAAWVADGDKGGAAAFKQTFPSSGIVVCSQHRGETARGKFGKGAKVRPFDVKLSRLLAPYPKSRRCTLTRSTRRRRRRSARPSAR